MTRFSLPPCARGAVEIRHGKRSANVSSWLPEMMQTQSWHVFGCSIELCGQGKSIHTADTVKYIFRIRLELGPWVFCMAAQGGKTSHFTPHSRLLFLTANT